MRTGYARLTVYVVELLLVAVLTACAAAQNKKIEHGFDIKFGTGQTIKSMIVQYGEFSREFCGGTAGCRSGYAVFYGVNMPIQAQMYVRWTTADGREHQTTVSVLDKIKDQRRFARLFLEFNLDKLHVQQGSSFSSPGLLGWDLSPLYP